MAQPNVVREPSMDEILASIRRIIESNEPVTSASVATAMAEPQGFSGMPANDDDDVTLTVDDAFTRPYENAANDIVARQEPAVAPQRAEAEMQAQPAAAQTQQPAQGQTRPLSLADVAARVRAASERNATVRDVQGAASLTEEPAASFSATSAAAPADAVQSEVQMPAAAEEAYESAGAEEATAEATRTTAGASLISSTTGEQVARSFQTLAQVIDQAERRSFDEMAEELLRPMLQEWLDNNLPTLVERLVREEIERVARGPRR